jgi:hypothetical protein
MPKPTVPTAATVFTGLGPTRTEAERTRATDAKIARVR